MTKNIKLQFQQSIDVPIEAVFYAFTNQTAMTQWLCSYAQINAQEGGAIFLNWSQPKYYAAGEFTKVKPNKRLAFTWQGRGEPGQSKVDVKFSEQEDSTMVALIHKGVGQGKKWAGTRDQIERGWGNGLENLKQVLETGLDKRVYDQPFLGVIITGLTSADEAEALGIKGGIKLAGAIEGTGAHDAGLEDQDILTNMAGIETDSFPKLQQLLSEHKAGDTISVAYFRHGEERFVDMVLSNRPAPDIPETPEALAESTQAIYEGLNSELDEITAGLPEEIAAYELPGDRWNAKQLMAHLLTNERSLQLWFASMVDHQNLIGVPNNPLPWINSVTDSFTMAELVDAFKHSESETVRLLANLPEDTVSRKATYIQIGFNVLIFYPTHSQGHFNEMRQAVADAQKAAA